VGPPSVGRQACVVADMSNQRHLLDASAAAAAADGANSAAALLLQRRLLHHPLLHPPPPTLTLTLQDRQDHQVQPCVFEYGNVQLDDKLL